MLRKIISLVTLICFISYLYGCSSVEVVQLNENNFEDIQDSDIISVVTKDNKIYEFETTGIKHKPLIRDSVLHGWVIGEKIRGEYKICEMEIPVKQLKTLEIKETDTTNTLLLMGVIIVAFIAIFSLTFEYNMNLGDVKWDPMGRH